MLVTLGNTIGAGFLGCVGSSILYGITIVQAYMYYIHYPRDWKFQKISVGILVFFDTVHLAMTTHAIYYYVIIQFGRPQALQIVVWSIKVQIVLNVIIVLFVQTLYVIRVWKLGSHFSRIWPVAVLGILLGGYVIGILLAVFTCQLDSWTSLKPISWVVQATFSTSTAMDVILSVSMCYYLHKSKNSFSVTNNRIVTIIHYVLITGSLTCAASMASLFTYVTMPDNLVFLGVSFLVTKLYTNSYIAMLNSRRSSQSSHDSSSYSVGRIMTGRSVAAHHVDPATINDVGEEKLGEDSLGLSSTSYRARLEQELSVDTKVRHHTNTQPEVIGIKVHRTEERRFDTADGNWNRV